MPAAKDTAQRDITLYVDTPSRKYPILFSEHVLSNPHTFKPYIHGDKVLIVTNTTIAPLYLQRVRDAIQALGVSVFEIILPDGEEYKSLQYVSNIWDVCMEHRLDRKSTMIALGGGVIGDTTGFAAASFVRGIPFIQVPTTLLAVVDSSVGGKTGINHPMGKNMIGAFYQPQAVIVDSQVLQTLNERQLAAGVAEIVKYGIIRDWRFFEWCERNVHRLINRDPEALQYAMVQSCKYKADIVGQDEREGGVRAILNLGHTFGHAIEASMGYGSWLHGEAVAAGMVMACEMSRRLGWISDEITKRVEAVLVRATLPTRPPPSVTLEKFMTFMSVDKKVEAGVLRLILLKGPGQAIITADFPESVLFDTIMHYQQLFKANPGTYEHETRGLPQ
ncbi:3-dehydroquinate synthase [Gracilaria domingensis]|nr:3-dehydroquinate synthase [Gracilaria domingensis]